MRVISVVNNKGGVAKTITAVNLAYLLAERGYKTLLVDTDQQANATANIGFEVESNMETIADVYLKKRPMKDVAHPTAYENLDIIPSGTAWTNGESQLMALQNEGSIERRMKVAARGLEYDFVVIDCPPVLSCLITNIFYITTDVIIPCVPDEFSLMGLEKIVQKVEEAQEEYNDDLQNTGILFTLADRRHVLTRQVIKEVEEGGLVAFDTTIPSSVAVKESTKVYTPVVKYAPNCKPSESYRALLEEVLEMVG